jgi:acyl carrier protein
MNQDNSRDEGPAIPRDVHRYGQAVGRLDRVRSILSHQLCLPLEAVMPTANLKDQLGMDSLDLAEMSILLEEDFGVEIEGICSFSTVLDIADFIGKRALSFAVYAHA